MTDTGTLLGTCGQSLESLAIVDRLLLCVEFPPEFYHPFFICKVAIPTATAACGAMEECWGTSGSQAPSHLSPHVEFGAGNHFTVAHMPRGFGSLLASLPADLPPSTQREYV